MKDAIFKRCHMKALLQFNKSWCSVILSVFLHIKEAATVLQYDPRNMKIMTVLRDPWDSHPNINNNGGVCSFSFKYVCECDLHFIHTEWFFGTIWAFYSSENAERNVVVPPCLSQDRHCTHRTRHRNTSHMLWHTHTPTVYNNVESSMSIWSAGHSGGSFSRRWRGSVINVCILLSKTLQSHCVQIRLELNYSSRHEPTEHRHIQMGRHV